MPPQVLPQAFYTYTTDPNPTTLNSTTLPLTLRAPLPSDIPALLSLLSNPANTADDLSVSKMSSSELETMLTTWLTPSQPLERMNFLVLAEGVPVGISGLGWIGPMKKAAHGGSEEGRAGAAGIMLEPNARGKGYAHEALRMSVDYGLRGLGLLEVRIGTVGRNKPMKGLMERKFGMEAEVTEPDRFGNDLVWKIGREAWLGREHR